MSNTTSPEKSTAAPKGKVARDPFTVTLQTEWFQRNRGKAITVRLIDGSRLSEVLEAWDTYTVALGLPGREETILVNKHGIALFRRFE